MRINFDNSCPVCCLESLTFHSTPSVIAGTERLEDPTYAVSQPLFLWKYQDLACSRVLLISYCIFTSAPSFSTRRSSARRSVAPMYVVVMTRSFPPRSVRARNSDSNKFNPLHFTKAHRRSTLSAVAISDRISLIRDGSPLAFVSKAASFKGVCGRVPKRRRLFTLRFGSTAVNSVGG